MIRDSNDVPAPEAAIGTSKGKADEIEVSLGASDDVENAVRSNPSLTRPEFNASMSKASRAFDRGNKGYLDEAEKVARSYDKNGDGTIQIHGAIKLAEDLQSLKGSNRQMKTILIASAGFITLLIAMSFGATWLAVSLSQQVAADHGALVSKIDGETLKTAPEGSVIIIEWDPSFVDRISRHLLGEIHRNLLGKVGLGESIDSNNFSVDHYIDAVEDYSNDSEHHRALSEPEEIEISSFELHLCSGQDNWKFPVTASASSILGQVGVD